jgi:Protein of unknown function (DUF1059)
MHALRYQCLENDCGKVVTAPDEDALIAAVNEHVASEHGSFELEEVVLAGAVRVDAEDEGA